MPIWMFLSLLALITGTFVALSKRAAHHHLRLLEQQRTTQTKVDALSEQLAVSASAHQHAVASLQAAHAQALSDLSMALSAATSEAAERQRASHEAQQAGLQTLRDDIRNVRDDVRAVQDGLEDARRKESELMSRVAELPGTVAASIPGSGMGTVALLELRELQARVAFSSKLFEASLLHAREGTPLAAGARRRSVVFVNHCYYHHYYLAAALRRRGWDAVMVNILHDTSGPDGRYFHGEDIDLYSSDRAVLERNIELFFEHARKRFDLMHFAGDFCLSLFPANFELDAPPDIVEWRSLGKKVGYTTSGCLSGVAQSTFAAWSAHGAGSLCDKCPWQDVPTVCCDERNLAWREKVERYCDVIFADTAPALDLTAALKTVRDPVSACLDAEFWRPDLPIPAEHVIAREPGEVLIYHSFGNFDLRTGSQRNIKGTPAVIEAVERLKAEGFPVRLVFVTGRKNTEVRFVQAQCDIIVDQLNAGRYGANAKEAMMLGKPVICYINQYENDPSLVVPAMRELPLVSASERTLYEVLKELVLDPARREEIGHRSREFAVKWHGPDGCAERYEEIYDLMMEGRLESEQQLRRQRALGAPSR